MSQEDLIARGDAAVTGFSGSKAEAVVSKGAHPLDVTHIDPAGEVLRIYDISKLGGPPTGKLVDVPDKLSIKAGEIGQVFGITFDSAGTGNTPNIYAAATSLFGLQIVTEKDGKSVRLAAGEVGAQWMPGQFGTRMGGGPGSIWKIDGRTGNASLFANVMSGSSPNGGPGLGALAFDPASKHLYVANLETGFVHRLDMMGKESAYFDHGTKGRAKAGLDPIAYDPSVGMNIENPSFKVEDPDTWGYTDKKRLVFALAIEGGRLYYSVAEGPQIWSVGLDKNGGFLDDARREIDVADTPSAGLVTAIVFDGPGNLLLTQRGEAAGSYEYAEFAKPNASVVRRYTWDETGKAWGEAFEEYPVGMKAPHRATNGGLALGYGYNASGAIDLDTCRATVWTTGEHLMDGAAGETRTIHGLQAVPKSTALAVERRGSRSGTEALYAGGKGEESAQLSPPSSAWFADGDGTFDRAKASGHFGAITIFAPCEEQVAEAVRPEPVPGYGYPSYPSYPNSPVFPGGPASPGSGGGLPDFGLSPLPWPLISPSVSITKTCTPAPLGGTINCTITVTNTGPVPLTEPVVFTDSTIGLDAGLGGGGPMAGAPEKISTVTPDAAAWTCTPPDTINLSCSLPPDQLPPGTSHSVTVGIDTSGFMSGGKVGFQNCASLGAPYWGTACADGGTDVSVTKTVAAGCTPGNPCDFTLTLTHSGSLPFSGSVQLDDRFFVLGAGASSPNFSITSGDLGCPGALPATLPVSCISNLSMAPGEQRSITMSVTMPAVPANYWAYNCFSVVDSASGGPPAIDLTAGGGTVGSGGAQSCVWIPVGAPPPATDLAIKKEALSCGKSPADATVVRCNYKVSISNNGPADFPGGAVTLTETLPLANATLVNAAALNCGPLVAGSATCTPAVPPLVSHGAPFVMEYAIDVPQADIEPAAVACRVGNTIAITNPVGGFDNFDPSNDSATAEGDAWHLETVVGGSVEVLCDPTNLVVTKKSNGDCVKSGAGYRCAYTVTVTNEGEDPHTGDIAIVDELAGMSPTRITHTTASPWQCVEGASLKCNIPKGPPGSEWPTLAKGASYSVDVTVDVPDRNACSVTNTARLTYPLAGTRWNKEGGDDKAEATSKIPDPDCRKPVCKPGEGEFRTLSGDCACKEGYSRGNDHRCQPVETAEVKPVEPEVKRCPDGYPIPKSGRCPCETGTWNEQTNRCEGQTATPIDPLTPPPPPPPSTTLECDSGWEQISSSERRTYRRKGYVVVSKSERNRTIWCAQRTVAPPPPPPSCDLECQCRQKGGKWTGKRCVTEPVRQPCPAGWTGTYQPDCKPPPVLHTCWNGKKVSNPKECPPQPTCEQKGMIGAYPNCRPKLVPCPKGWTGTYQPDCKAPPVLHTCWNGQKVSNPKACPPKPTCEQKGMIGVYPNCKPKLVPCPKGWTGAYQPNCKPPPVLHTCWNGQKVTSPKACPPKPTCEQRGMIGVYPNCKPKLVPCPKGWTGAYQPNCKPPAPGGGTGCPKGQYFSPQLKRCVPLI